MSNTPDDDIDMEADESTRQETDGSSWFMHDGSDDIDVGFKDYEITATPNDFNVATIINFIDSGSYRIPGFQRNFVWDLRRSSKLIESILIGLPVPQVFLYQQERNSFLVIDGQQRLMSIYYFAKGRFPRRDKRPEIRRLVDSNNGTLPAGIFADDRYFQKFNLSLPGPTRGQHSKFHKKNYETLGDDKTTFDLRPVRNVIIKQDVPKEDRDSSVFEIFNRLNTGGVNLRPQEIRTSLYHSGMLETLNTTNLNPIWRRLLDQAEPDLHAKDTEVLLRALALTAVGETYTEPLGGFLNAFAKGSRSLSNEKLTYTKALFEAFFDRIREIPPEAFRVDRSGRFSIAMFEAVFRAACSDAFAAGNTEIWALNANQIVALKADEKFIEATREGIGRATHVNTRFQRARALLAPG
jgi:hypothetical protein